MINRAEELGLLNNDDIYLLRRISIYRNNTIHQGRVPEKVTTWGILDIARHLLQVLKLKSKDDKKHETTNKLWSPLPIIYFKVAQILLRILHFPQVGWEAYNKSPYQLEVRIEVHPILGGRDLHPLPDNDINGNSIYPVEPYSPLFINGCFTLPPVCAVSKEELVLEIRATVTDINSPEKGSYALLPQRWKYVRERNLWSYYPQQLKNR